MFPFPGSIADPEHTGLIAQRSYIIVLCDVYLLLAHVHLPGAFYAHVWCWELFPGLEGCEGAEHRSICPLEHWHDLLVLVGSRSLRPSGPELGLFRSGPSCGAERSSTEEL